MVLPKGISVNYKLEIQLNIKYGLTKNMARQKLWFDKKFGNT